MASTHEHLVLPFPEPRAARIAVAAIFCLNGLAFSNWIARIPDVKLALGMSEGTLGIVLLFSALGALVAQPVTGWACGRFGSFAVVRVLGVLFCLSVALPGIVTSVPLLMLALFILGAFNGGLDVAMNAQAALVEQRYQRPIMSSFHGLWSVGGLIGALIGGAAASWKLDVSTHLVLVAIMSCGLTLFIVRWLLPDAGMADAKGQSFALPPRSLLILGLIAFGVLLCEGAVGDWAAIYLRENLGSTAGVAATGYAAFALMMAIGRLSGDWLALRFGAAMVVRVGGLLVILGMAAALLTSTPVLAVVGFGLVGAGLAAIFPLILSAATRTPQVAVNTAIAAMATMGYTGFLVGPPLIGGLAELFSLPVALGLLGLFGFLVVVAGGTVGKRY